MIKLTDNLFLGKGRRKVAYFYPGDDTKCVKVLMSSDKKSIKEHWREIRCNLWLQKRHSHLPEIAKYRGTVETNLGTGYVWDIVRDADGSISEALEQYVRAGEFLNDQGKELGRTLLELGSAMLEKEIIPMGLFSRNILCKKGDGGKIKLVIIDDLGTAALIPFEYYFSFAARSRIKRRWNRMLDGDMKNLHDSDVYKKILTKVRL